MFVLQLHGVERRIRRWTLRTSPSVDYFLSCPPGRCPVACLWVALTNRLREQFTHPVFFFRPFEWGVTDHMWGTTQAPVSGPLNVPFMLLRRCSISPSSIRLMWSLEKEMQQVRSVYFLLRSMYKFRTAASADDVGHLPSACTLIIHLLLNLD